MLCDFNRAVCLLCASNPQVKIIPPWSPREMGERDNHCILPQEWACHLPQRRQVSDCPSQLSLWPHPSSSRYSSSDRGKTPARFSPATLSCHQLPAGTDCGNSASLTTGATRPQSSCCCRMSPSVHRCCQSLGPYDNRHHSRLMWIWRKASVSPSR